MKAGIGVAAGHLSIADIEDRIKRYSKCLSQCSKNYREWLIDDYKLKLTLLIGKKYREKIMNEPDEDED